MNYALAAGDSIYLNVYADVASGATNGDATADTLIESIAVDGTGADSSSTVNVTATAGQTMTFGAGTFTTALDGSTPTNKIAAADQEAEALKVRFTAQNETYTIKELRVSVSSTTVASAVSSIRVYDGTTLLGTSTIGTYSTTAALISGLSTDVSANSYKTLTFKLVLNDVGTGAGSSQVNVEPTLANTLYQDTQGTQSNETNSRNGNEVYVYKSIPTISLVDLSNSGVSNGSTTDLYKFTIAANSNGSVAIKQLRLALTWADGATGDTLTVGTLRFYKDGTEISSSVVMQDEDGNNAESGGTALGESDDSLYITWATEEVIDAGTSVTYLVRGIPSGFHSTGTAAGDVAGSDTFSLYLIGDTAHNGTAICLNTGTATTTITKLLAESSSDCSSSASGSATVYNLIWSDLSQTSHQNAMADYSGSADRGDWANSYLVQSLDLSSEAWAP